MDLFLALLPALIMIVMVLVTRKVILSLGTGIISGALIYNIKTSVENETFNFLDVIGDTLKQIFDAFLSVITSLDGKMSIIMFVTLIGSVTAIITVCGGTRALATRAKTKIKSAKHAQIMTWIYGLIISIDDYFNALVIGEVSKPITDDHKVSRAKLSYIIDSTSAPVVILLPVSTWAAYIISSLDENLAINGFSNSGFSAFLNIIPLQFYPITAIVMVLLVALYKIDIGPMKKYEQSVQAGDDISMLANKEDVSEFLPKSEENKLITLIVPMGLLIGGTLATMLVFTLVNGGSYFNQNISLSLFIASIASLISAVYIGLKTKGVKKKDIEHAGVFGAWGMLKSAVLILVFAWMMGAILESLNAGEYLGEFLQNSSFPILLIPVFMFLVSAFIAFATGTSWGTFAIVIPIGTAIAGGMDVDVVGMSFIFSILAAGIGGAVLGDHCSPISDTTVLSATGAGSTLDSHFSSQLPYALTAGLIAVVAYLVFGLTQVIILGYVTIGVMLAAFVFISKKFLSKQ